MTKSDLVLLPAEEHSLRLDKVRQSMQQAGITSALISTNANLYYLTGRVFSGYIYIAADGRPTVCFVKRPVLLSGDNIVEIRKPENIPAALAERGVSLDSSIGLELGRITYSGAIRLQRALGADTITDINPCLAEARSTKTAYEIALMRRSGVKQTEVYRRIPRLYKPGMSDIELQIEIERQSRLEGCLGQFRIAGEDMEIHMGSILVGDNADNPSPYDFAMGGAGIDPSMPGGADGTIIDPGMSVMVDMNGNYTGYMTDMTRCYYVGRLPARAFDAHRLSIDICHELARMGTPGTPAKDLYDKACEMARQAGLEQYFMGHRQHAGFVGHGVGIEVNELPVLTGRSRSILAVGNTIAIEPKFVLPGIGAVGIENTYLVQADGPMQTLTAAPEELTKLD